MAGSSRYGIPITDSEDSEDSEEEEEEAAAAAAKEEACAHPTMLFQPEVAAAPEEAADGLSLAPPSAADVRSLF